MLIQEPLLQVRRLLLWNLNFSVAWTNNVSLQLQNKGSYLKAFKEMLISFRLVQILIPWHRKSSPFSVIASTLSHILISWQVYIALRSYVDVKELQCPYLDQATAQVFQASICNCPKDRVNSIYRFSCYPLRLTIKIFIEFDLVKPSLKNSNPLSLNHLVDPLHEFRMRNFTQVVLFLPM